ncbi:MAG: ATP-binding protein [Saprospiraceae bacterium]
MKEDAIEALANQIEALNLPKEKKEEFAIHLKKIKKQQQGLAFRVERISKDKTIVTNVLNATIAELGAQKELVEEQSEQLKLRLKELKHSYNEVEQFSYIASHDLKSPLRNISNFAQILQRKYQHQLDGEANEYLDFVVNGTKQMNMIICDLLEYSKVGHSVKGLEAVNLYNIIELIQFNLGTIIEEHQVKIKIVDQLPVIPAKKSSIIQLFQNLIENAIKFRSEEHPIINIHCRKVEEELWEFKIVDNGIGIEPCYQDKAFLPFQRLNQGNRPGTGIGLAICKKAVKMHGGSIKFESEKGAGTSFVFTLAG